MLPSMMSTTDKMGKMGCYWNGEGGEYSGYTARVIGPRFERDTEGMLPAVAAAGAWYACLTSLNSH